MDDQLLAILTRLVDFVEMASPKLWEITLRQVYVQIAKGAILTLLFFIATLVGILVGRQFAKLHKESPREDYDIASILAYSLAGGIAIASIAFLIDTVQYLINPEYYAVKLLLNLMP